MAYARVKNLVLKGKGQVLENTFRRRFREVRLLELASKQRSSPKYVRGPLLI